MIQATIFAGHEGQLRYERKLFITLFAGTELVRPTFARQVLAMKAMSQNGLNVPPPPPSPMAALHGGPNPLPLPRLPLPRPYFFTMFGATEIKSPTLAAEFIDLRELSRSGALSRDDWERAMALIASCDTTVGAFTLFGGFDENVLPEEDEEIDSLAVQCHLGTIEDGARRVLQSGIGRRDPERRAIVQRAVETVA